MNIKCLVCVIDKSAFVSTFNDIPKIGDKIKTKTNSYKITDVGFEPDCGNTGPHTEATDFIKALYVQEI
jgi:hypothetical protein